MRLELIFKLENLEFPKESRKAIISFIKKSLTESRKGRDYDKFFNRTVAKPYCFSIKFDKPEFKQDCIGLGSSEVKILFSIVEKEEALAFKLFFAFISQKNKKFPLENGNFMILKQIVEKKEIEITSSKVLFKTAMGGGLCVRDHKRENKNKDQYYVQGDEKFQEQLEIVLKAQGIEAGFVQEKLNTLRCNPLQMKKVLVWHYHCYIPTGIGMIQMEGDPELLNYFYQAGICSRRSAGFGMIELVAQDLF